MEIKIICFSNPGSVCCLQKLFIFVAMLGKESARQDILTKRFCLSLIQKRPISDTKDKQVQTLLLAIYTHLVYIRLAWGCCLFCVGCLAVP